MKKKILVICILSFIIGLLIYINPTLIYRNTLLSNHLEKINTKEELKPKELVPFNYDKLHIIYPYTSKKDIEQEIGIKNRHIKENNNDNYQTLIVIKNNKVIASTNIPLTYNFQPLKGNNYISSSQDTIIRIHKHDTGYSFIEQYKYISESFYDIKYQLPGSYWEEDDEEPGKFYYLGINSNDYLLVTKKEKFNYKEYIKNKDINISEDKIINKYKIKYLECNALNNSIDIIYIINIKDTTYIFALNTSKEKLEINKENLYNIVLSIKE